MRSPKNCFAQRLEIRSMKPKFQTATPLLLTLLAAIALANPAFGDSLSEVSKASRLENARQKLLAHLERDPAKEKGLLVDTLEPRERFLAIVPMNESYDTFFGIAWQLRDPKMSRFSPQPLLITTIRTAAPFSAMPDHVEVVDDYANPIEVLRFLKDPNGSYDLSSRPSWADRKERTRVENEIIEILKPDTHSMKSVMCRRLFTGPSAPGSR